MHAAIAYYIINATFHPVTHETSLVFTVDSAKSNNIGSARDYASKRKNAKKSRGATIFGKGRERESEELFAYYS